MNIRCSSNLQARTGKEKVGRDGETDGETKTDRKRKGGTKTENDGTKRGTCNSIFFCKTFGVMNRNVYIYKTIRQI